MKFVISEPRLNVVDDEVALAKNGSCVEAHIETSCHGSDILFLTAILWDDICFEGLGQLLEGWTPRTPRRSSHSCEANRSGTPPPFHVRR